MNDRSFIFAGHPNLLGWPSGWTFMLSWLTPIWSIGAFDSCVHMSEEAANATIAVPYGILFSIGSCWLLGFIVMIIITACIDKDLSSVRNTPFGQPMAQVKQIFCLDFFALLEKKRSPARAFQVLYRKSMINGSRAFRFTMTRSERKGL